MATRSAHTIVVGLGNPVLKDDAVGLKVADRLRGLLAEQPLEGVQVVSSTRGGFELLDLLTGYARAVIVDALTLCEPLPGRVHELDLTRLSGMARLVGSHDISLSQAFQLAAQLHIPMPGEVFILGVEVAEVHELSEELSSPVAQVIEPLARRIYALLAGDGSPLEGRGPNALPAPPGALCVP